MPTTGAAAHGPVPAGGCNEHSHAPHAALPHHHDGLRTELRDTRRPIPEGALIGCRGLAIRRNGRALLDDVDLDIMPGEIVTLIGPNGAGKTTLVRALLGLVAPDAGQVHRRPSLRTGYVPQRFDVDGALPMTVARFLALGIERARRPATQGRAAAALAEVGASHTEHRQLAELSGGELQRVALARALSADPELLVLDEPVRGVDYAGEAELYTLIASLRNTRGLGVLMVSHDLHVVMASSDRVVCLNRHVCCSGVPETVAQHPEYVRLFGVEASPAFALYHHHHDHRHDLAGGTASVETPRAEEWP